MSILLRLATPADLPAINSIYNHFVATSTCTYQLQPSTPEERQQWFNAHLPSAASSTPYPITVAVPADNPTLILGWASLSPFHPRPAYRFTAEDSVYIHPAHLRQGLGRRLLTDLLVRADALGFRSVVGLISGDQEPSITLHTRLGFTHAGRLQNAGYKFGRWLDVVYLQRMHPDFREPVAG